MNHLPTTLFQYLANHSIQQLEPAWLKLEKHSDIIIDLGGTWQHYSPQIPQTGQSATTIFDVLLGMLPIHESFELPQVQLQNEQYTDIFAIQDNGCDWLLFCDVTQNTLQLQQYQQVSNDLILLKAQMKQTLHRYIGHEVVARIEQGEMLLDAAGERKNISTLFVDIRGFTPFNERHDAQIVMQTLNDYMNCMLPPIMQHHGMIDKIMGDGV
ncbi:MAG: adenylate/guanylate cyclase domain-containing protein, partial [Ghiorsea sp.]|nr:adenylate/guanylate cyclase domain-containing protein [Ghiorsea sp.]